LESNPPTPPEETPRKSKIFPSQPKEEFFPLPESQEEVINITKELYQKALQGQIVSLLWCGETIDEGYGGYYTMASKDMFGRFGFSVWMAIKALDYQMRGDDPGSDIQRGDD
jgi:hypothetical protein